MSKSIWENLKVVGSKSIKVSNKSKIYLSSNFFLIPNQSISHFIVQESLILVLFQILYVKIYLENQIRIGSESIKVLNKSKIYLSSNFLLISNWSTSHFIVQESLILVLFYFLYVKKYLENLKVVGSKSIKVSNKSKIYLSSNFLLIPNQSISHFIVQESLILDLFYFLYVKKYLDKSKSSLDLNP